MRFISFAAAAAFTALASSQANADILTGRVVGPDGLGVENVDIDILNALGGDDPEIQDDRTDALGFFTIVVPPGLYDVEFFPPAPPATTLLNTVVESVAVFGTQDLGTIGLELGVGITGRVLQPNGLPQAGIDLDVEDLTTGQDLLLTNDDTDVLGRFTLAVPAGPFELRLDATTVQNPNFVSQAFEYDLDQSTDLGDFVLEAGFVLTGRALGPGNVPVVNADVDVVRADGSTVETPGDNTDSQGFFQVVAPAGVLDVNVCPGSASPLAGVEQVGLVVSSNSNLGVFDLPSGVSLSGQVIEFDGAPADGADIDLLVPLGGVSVFLCGDSVKADGSYAIRAPAGTYDVVFEPANFDEPLGADVFPGFQLTTAQILDGVLPSCPFPTNYGFGKAGTGGVVPTLSSFGGAPRADNGDFGLRLEGAVGGGFGALAVGFAPSSLPLLGGTLFVDILGPLISFNYVASGDPGVAGAGAADFPIPVDAAFAGVTVYAQAYVVDLGAEGFLALSDAIETTFCQ